MSKKLIDLLINIIRAELFTARMPFPFPNRQCQALKVPHGDHAQERLNLRANDAFCVVGNVGGGS